MAWTREVYELPEGHGWTARPGHKILVLDRGAVVLEFPGNWFVEPGPREVDIRDAPTTDASTCILAVSCMRLPPLDWSALPLSGLLLDAAQGDDRDRIATGPVHETARDSLSLAWAELRVVDPSEHRECRSRICLARSGQHQCLITFDFWPEDAERLSPVWDGVLHSLRLGARVEDPARGRKIG